MGTIIFLNPLAIIVDSVKSNFSKMIFDRILFIKKAAISMFYQVAYKVLLLFLH
jgi:hypothetical protein